MKNNSLAMLAVVCLVGAVASMIGYIEPGTCTVPAAPGLLSCQDAANQRILAFWIFAVIGVGTIAGSFLRRKLAAKRSTKNS